MMTFFSIILFLVIASIIIYNLGRALAEYEKCVWIGVSVLGIILSLFITIAISCFITKIATEITPQFDKNKYYYLSSFTNASQMSGSFILGSGTIEQTDYYLYNVIGKDGIVYASKIESNSCVLKVWDKDYAIKKEAYYKCSINLFNFPGNGCVEKDTIFIPRKSFIERITYNVENYR